MARRAVDTSRRGLCTLENVPSRTRAGTLRVRAASFRTRGLYREAEACLLEALRHLDPRQASAVPDLLLVWNDLGITYKYLGKFQKAHAYYRLALQYSRRVFRDCRVRDSFLASLYHNLAGLEHSRRHFLRGVRLARKGLRLRLAAEGKCNIAVASDMVALAALLDGHRKFAESEILYLKALPIYRLEYGTSHPELAVLLHNLASHYHNTKRYAEAEPLFWAALRMRRRELGTAHPDLAVTLNNLGMLYYSQGESQQAARHFRQALRILVRTPGSRHPYTRAVCANYRLLWRAKKK